MRAAWGILATLLVGTALSGAQAAGERVQRFDRDPGWEGHNNRSTAQEPRQVKQAFGYSATTHAGGNKGEVGGTITPDGEAAYYARPIPPRTFEQPLEASGKLNGQAGGFHALFGFFNNNTLNEWRTPNTVVLRLQGRGDYFYAYLEYCTDRWRAGADSPVAFATKNPTSGKMEPIEFPLNKPLNWTLKYDPTGNGGQGVITAVLNGHTSICHLGEGHKLDGARFNRFGLLSIIKSVDSPGELWFDDLNVLGERESFDRDPGWEGRGNRREYISTNIRPRFNFGYSPTQFADGTGKGELGGLMFRGDGRYPERIAYYADKVGPLAPTKPIRASGRVVLRRGVSDSSTLFGFFDSQASVAVNDSQANGFPDHFLGLAIEGPSAEGFFVYPVFRTMGEGVEGSRVPMPNRILPDGKSHAWSLEFDPQAEGGQGAMTLRLDQNVVRMPLPEGLRARGAKYDRFGFVTTRVDGNAQQVYFDDLTYTAE